MPRLQQFLTDWKRTLPLILFLVILLWAAQSVHAIVPSEDAYITFRYARHLAEGKGLVWNPGENPVEGSTEFLWVLLLAAGRRLGMSIEQAALAFSALAAGLNTLLIGSLAYWLGQRRGLPVLLAAGAFAVGPAAYYIHFGFATNLFSLLMVGMLAAQLICLQPQAPERRQRLACALLAGQWLLLGLTRPEGVFYGLLVMVCTFVLANSKTRKDLLRASLLYFLLPGLFYFIWRWRYFGYLLPNTFYVKSNGKLWHGRYLWDVYKMFRFNAPLFLLIGGALMLDQATRARRMLLLLLPALLFPWLYVLIDQTQNIGGRFQYPVYPIYLLAAAYGAHVLVPPLRSKLTSFWQMVPFLAGAAFILFAIAVPLDQPTFLVMLGLTLLGIYVWRQRTQAGTSTARTEVLSHLLLALFSLLMLWQSYQLALSFYRTQFDDRHAIGLALHPYADKGYTIVVSEAGWIPYFSEWRAIDSFGLNDEYITHHGLTTDYLDSVKADIIMYHEVENPNPPRWRNMVALLRTYAETHGYVLTAIIERKGENDLHVYYVRRDNPDAAALMDAITRHDQFDYQFRLSP